MFNLKKKNSGFSRFEGNIFFSIKHQTQSVITKRKTLNLKFLEFFELFDYLNKWWKFVWFKFIHRVNLLSVGAGATSPLSPYRHGHQSGWGPATDRGEGWFFRHIHEWCRTRRDPGTHQVHQVTFIAILSICGVRAKTINF